MKIFDPRTGRFLSSADSVEIIALLCDELTARELGAEPNNWPSDSPAKLQSRLSFWNAIRSAEIAENR